MTPSMQVLTPRASLRLQFTLGPPGCAISQTRLVSSRRRSVPCGQGRCLPCPVQPRYHLLLETESATCVSCAPAIEDGRQPLHLHRNLLLLEIRLLGSGSPSSWGRPGWAPSWRVVVRGGGHAWLSLAKPLPHSGASSRFHGTSLVVSGSPSVGSAIASHPLRGLSHPSSSSSLMVPGPTYGSLWY